jgi:hypothetical protein
LKIKPYEFYRRPGTERKLLLFRQFKKGKDGLIHREYTKIVLIDVVDNKPAEGQLPETIELQYSIEPRFRAGHTPVANKPLETLPIELPTTINPSQTPKLIGAGVALSPYNRNEKYSATEVRTRFLWLEFDNKPRDNNDALFCRVLAYSPDQLISNNHPSLMDLPKEKPLSLNPEYIRVSDARKRARPQRFGCHATNGKIHRHRKALLHTAFAARNASRKPRTFWHVHLRIQVRTYR